MPRKNKNKKQLKPRKSRPKAKRTTRKASAAKKAAKTAVVAAVLSPQKLQELYATMLKCRMLSERVESLDAQTSRKTRAAEVEREAVLTGAIAHAITGDETVTAQSGSLVAFIKGTPLTSILAGFSVPVNEVSLGQAEVNGIGSHIESTLQRGTALATTKKGSSTVVLAFAGELGTERPALHEQLRAAARNKLPIVCLVETNLAEMDALPPSTVSSKAGDDHFPQIAVDGNDVVAVFRVAQEAIRRARTGHGPSMIECVMPEQAVKRSIAHDSAKKLSGPLAFMQQYLERRKLWSGEWQQKIAQEFTYELDTTITAMGNASSQQNRVDPAYSAKLGPEPASA